MYPNITDTSMATTKRPPIMSINSPVDFLSEGFFLKKEVPYVIQYGL